MSLAPSTEMPSTTLPSLTEDVIDDLLYFARTGELEDLQTTLSALAKTSNIPHFGICSAALDAGSGNGLLHMASANGHDGSPFESSSFRLLVLRT